MAPAIQMLWEQIPGPKYAIAMGACTISGGPFIYDNYSVVRGAQNLIPVDVFVPGCPPRPEALFHGLLTLREKILHETCREPWHEGEPKDVSTMDRYREAAKTWAALEEMKDEEMAEVQGRKSRLQVKLQAYPHQEGRFPRSGTCALQASRPEAIRNFRQA